MSATPAKNMNASPDFTISRVFETSRDAMWDLWTNQENMGKWWGPKGVKIRAGKMDLRPGGMFHYCMVTPTGQEMWGKAVYREVHQPSKIVWVNSFSNEAGEITRHPMNPNWPREMLTTITFDEIEPGKTKVTVRWVPINPTDIEQKTFDENHPSMQQGWTGTFDQLEEHIDTL